MAKKEYTKISISIDKDLNDKMSKMFINKSRLINNLIQKAIKKKNK